MRLLKLNRCFYKKITNIETVPRPVVSKYLQKTYYIHQLVAFTGFIFGLRTCDLLMYDEHDYIDVREQMENEYWAFHGEPRHIKPDIIPCMSRAKAGETCRSWIQIKYDKDKYLRKIDPAELKSANK